MPDPVSWFVVERGWEVVGSDGSKLGTVEEMLGDPEQKISRPRQTYLGYDERPFVPMDDRA